jgi:U32 family peptidase
MTTRRRRPEVLAPVGSPDCLPAAVAGGADAVFLGLRHFNARGRAENFRKAELPQHVAYLHHHGVKCYLVMNTLVHDDEYVKALDLAAAAHAAGVDAAIIQDLGLWRTLTRELPAFKRHASTQMTIHSPSQVAVMAELGAERVILARELSFSEVAACTREADRLGIETEHFVHGALCYAFSGQCLMSNFAGCRSANRGTCAQNCRFDYQRNVPSLGKENSESAIDTEISMKDLSLIARIGELADIGVASLKIEGRLKGADYVYTTSRVYRAATEAWAQGKRFDVKWARELLKDVFARAQTDAPLNGNYSAASRIHRYEPEQDRTPDATLLSIDRARGEAVVRAGVAITAGQGFAFSVGFFNGGFLVTKAESLGDRWRCKIRIAEHGPRLPAGMPLFRNADHERKREAITAMAAMPVDAVSAPTIGLALQVSAIVGQPLTIHAKATDGRVVMQVGESPLVAATGRPLDEVLLNDKLGAFGGTGYHAQQISLSTTGSPFVPATVLKEQRRQLIDKLNACVLPSTAPTWAPPEPGTPQRKQTQIWVSVNSIEAGHAAIAAGASAVWLDNSAIDWWSANSPNIPIPADSRWWVRQPATAPVSSHLAQVGRGVVAGHVGVIKAARDAGLPVIADVFCNTFSTETMLALQELGASAVVISLECSCREIARLAARCGSLNANGMMTPALAVIAHGRLPAMLTRQDHGIEVGKTLSITATVDDGGLPYELQRRAHGDTVIWEGRRLCAPEHLAPTAGLVDAWILELNDLAPDAVAEITAAYAALRSGTTDPQTIISIAHRHSPHGIFSGHLAQGSRELDLVVERMDAEVSA